MGSIFLSRHWNAFVRVAVVSLLAGFCGLVWLAHRHLDVVRDPVVRLGLAFIGVQLALLLFMTAALTAIKHIQNVRSAARRKRLLSAEQLLTEFATGGPGEPLLAQAERFPEEFLSAIDRTLDWLRGNSRTRVIELFEQTALFGRTLRDTAHPEPHRALRAILLLAKMPSETAQDALEAGMTHAEPVVRMAALRTVVAIGRPEARVQVLDVLPRLALWEKMVLFQSVPYNDPMLERFLQRAIRSSQDDMILVALECILCRQRTVPVWADPRLMESGNVEVRIKFFKALPYLHVDGDPFSLLATGLDDTDWRVRAMAAKSCSHFRDPALAGRLMDLIASGGHQAEVHHAARALAAVGGRGIEWLSVLKRSDQEMIRRTVSEALEQRLLAGEKSFR